MTSIATVREYYNPTGLTDRIRDALSAIAPEDRTLTVARLAAEIRRALKSGGRFATYDVVSRDDEVVYPVPWARDASTSFLLTEDATRSVLERTGFTIADWRDDTQAAIDWFAATMSGPAPSGPGLSIVIGPEYAVRVGNLARNLREDRVGVLSAVLTRD